MAATRTRRKPNSTGPVRALGYLRVSTEGQVESGAGLDAQRAAIEAEAARQGWQLDVVTDTGSGAHLNRPALVAALDRLDRGDADLLLAAKLDRVSRSVKDFTELLERAHREGWRLVLLDLGDTSTATGELTANMIASAAQYERRLIGQRTREGLAAKRAAGVRLGRPSVLPREVVARIVAERAEGRSMRVIAEGLTGDGVSTARGGAEWKVSSVQAVLKSQDAADLNGIQTVTAVAASSRPWQDRASTP